MPKSENYKPWTLKYRPLKLSDIQIEANIKEKFLNMLYQNNIPNLIIYGPPGSGKTSIVECITNKISDQKSNNFLKLNASHVRGIDVVRLKIKSFCQLKINLKKNSRKLIVIDEAESLSEIAQEALRRTVENFSHIVRFIFICNYPSKIIEAIQSRCTVLRFNNITESIIIRKITKILCIEKILFSIKGLEMLIFLAEGDMRRLLNEAEISSRSFFKLTDLTVKICCFVPSIFMIAEFLYVIFNRNHLLAFEIFTDICNEGYNIAEIIYGIFKYLKRIRLFHFKKLKILKFLCELQIGLFEQKCKLNFVLTIIKKFFL
uniref:AAA+ ATPase domain-containing protein n=2 Tax=Cryptomonas curvata TaxID=233186 RepID=A0A7S0N7L5_9CRYP|mmetsp:Transcript_8648/g.18616  ORF Transcript_8648/g.18616 Transcript_8648/m.18616 type:complete len:318 (+) Transcript_8648:96-1049(+)